MKKNISRVKRPKTTPFWWKWQTYANFSYGVVALMKIWHMLFYSSQNPMDIIWFRLLFILLVLLSIAMLAVLGINVRQARRFDSAMALVILAGDMAFAVWLIRFCGFKA